MSDSQAVPPAAPSPAVLTEAEVVAAAAPAAIPAVAEAVSDAETIVTGPDLAARVAASGDLLQSIVNFLHWAFPNHPALPGTPTKE